MNSSRPIERACKAVGGQAELSRVLGITPAAVSQWCNGVRDVPAERCPVIERATRKAAIEADDPKLIVTCEQLRPDVEWSVLRDPGNTAPSELLPEAAQ